MLTRNIIPIPPSFDSVQGLNLDLTKKYMTYLKDNGGKVVMTTAGTSQFNLINRSEIHSFNLAVSSFSGDKILGIPPVNLFNAQTFVDDGKYYNNSSDTNLMAIYPDRYYDFESLYSYFSGIRDRTKKPIYIHAMFMRKGTGGSWDYDAETITKLFDRGVICGLKEEHSNLQESFNFINKLPKALDIIVAGGSMRRHAFLKHAGANSFLSGLGNFFPDMEYNYCSGIKKDHYIRCETKLFNVFNKYGWHRSLRVGLKHFLKFSEGDRMPWPKEDKAMIDDINSVLIGLKHER